MSRSWVRMSGALAPPWTRGSLMVHSPAHLWRLWPASVASIATSRPVDLQIKHSTSAGPIVAENLDPRHLQGTSRVILRSGLAFERNLLLRTQPQW